jgi:hypothetical protein
MVCSILLAIITQELSQEWLVAEVSKRSDPACTQTGISPEGKPSKRTAQDAILGYQL